MNYEKLALESLYARRTINPDLTKSFEYKRNKDIKNKFIIYETGLENVSLVGRGRIELSNDLNYNHQNTLKLYTNTDIENISPRPSSSIKISLNHLDLTKYNYFGAYVYIKSVGITGMYFHFMTGNKSFETNHAPFIYPNTWQFISWDATHIVRSDVNLFSITPYLMGTPIEAISDVEIYIDSIFAYNDKPLYDLGWDIDGIAFCHSGYFTNGEKHAITSCLNLLEFKVVGKKTYTFKTKQVNSYIGSYLDLDFSSLNEEGIYHIEIGSIKSENFIISNNCFNNSVLKSLNFLRSLRCGENIEGVHTKCHLNCRSYCEDGSSVPNFGGWHDAGDVSQFEIPTAEITLSLLELATCFKGEEKNRIREECKIGLDWLYQTRAKDGYRAMQVTYSIFRKNLLEENNKTVFTNACERGAFENTLSSIAFIKGAKEFKYDKIYSDYLYRLAIEDFDISVYEYENNIYTKRWGKPICSQTLGALIYCAGLIYEFNQNDYYLEYIDKNIKTLLSCQDKSLNDLKGFFYEDPDHKYILSYEHRAHEEYPLLGINIAYKLLKDLKKKDLCYESLILYSSYIKNSIKYTSPLNLLPAGVYNINKVNYEHFTIILKLNEEEKRKYLQDQITEGVNISGDYYLRLMPISYTRRGFLTTLLSKTIGVAITSLTLNDAELHNIALRQIEWTLGLNPFSTSLMYGEGYNYHNLYVAFSKQIVGALPVGMMTKGNLDMPYWPDYTNAVFKEIWGNTTGKFLYTLSLVLKGMN